jgi:hypothetical protein
MGLSRPARAGITILVGAVLAAIIRPACTESSPDAIEVVSRAAVARYDWMQFGGGPSHSGNNTLEQTITASNVAGLRQLFQVHLPETIEGQPMVLTNVGTSSGTRDVAFMTTRNGYLVALDAHAGTLIWQHQFPGTNITMSSPAIDPSRAFIYAAGIDGLLHKVNVADGGEVTGGGWPEVASLKNSVEKDGTALTIGTAGGVSYLYMGTGGYDGDGGDYQGHLTAVNLSTGAQKVFNAMCSNQTIHFSSSPDCAGQKSGVWAKAGVTFDTLAARVYMGTGNGTFAPSSFYWGDSILALNPDGSGAGNGNPLDSYTPGVYQTLQNADLDLGSTNLLILADNGSKVPHLGMQSGKDAVVRLIDLDDMSGQGAPGKVAGEVSSIALPTGGAVQNPCATWVDPADHETWMYVSSPTNGVNAFVLVVDGGGNPSLAARWRLTTAKNGGVTIANNVLYYANDNNLRALDPTTGAQLWNATSIGPIHWQTPTVANGVVYVGDNSREVTAFGLGGSGTDGSGTGGSGGGGSGGGGAGSGGSGDGSGGGGAGGSAGGGGSGGSAGGALTRTGWTASASQTAGADVPAHALDGNPGTRWTTGVPMTNGMYFEVDMKATSSFNRIVMDAGANANDFPRAFQILVSTDRAKYATVATGTASAAVVQVTFAAQSARYIKIRQTGTAPNPWSMAELEVYANATATGSGGSSAGGSGGMTGTAGTTGTGGVAGVAATRINCGGPASPPFGADVDYSGGTTVSHPANVIDTSGVTDPAPAAVYQTARIGSFKYAIPGFTPGSSHVVRLHLCEMRYAAAGLRRFDVTINGSPVLTNFDLFATIGQMSKALVEEFTVAADASGRYVIQTRTLEGSGIVSGIEIR